MIRTLALATASVTLAAHEGELRWGIAFPSAEWTEAFKHAINANEAYRKAGKDWTHGRVAYVVEAAPELGLENRQGMILDLAQGECRDALFVDGSEAEQADFVIEADFSRWKEVLTGGVDPTKAMMQGKLKLKKGHLPTVIKYVQASKELVNSANRIETDFPV